MQIHRFTLFTDLFYILLFACIFGSAYLYFVDNYRIVTLPPPIYDDPTITYEDTRPDSTLKQFDFPEFREYSSPPPRLRPKPPEHVAAMLDSIYEQLDTTHTYDPAYVRISYPGGDVAPEVGVCTDVVVRAFREQGVDLQQNIHEDMRRHFRKYPKKWGLRSPDTNIDHRRVPNMMTYFKRRGVDLPISNDPDNYQPGDVVAWKLNDKQNHIGIVMKARSYDDLRPLIGHNIDRGVMIEDVLFQWEIIGHYRYFDKPLQQVKNEL